MTLFFLILAGLSLSAMVGGLVWAVTVSKRAGTRGPGGPRVPEEAGSFSNLKALVQAGDWGHALPAILAIGGLLGLLLFSSLAAVVGLEEPLWGVAALLVSLYVIVRTLWNIAQA
ncbi:MAG: hypothetical protein ACP5UM_03445 [Anaerolineae bacterium]